MAMLINPRFWSLVDQLADQHTLIIDRPKGSAHPRYPDHIYPLDYGYLEGTTAGDGDGIDVWVGSLADKRVQGANLHDRLFEAGYGD
jgi:inorganic pyrophosphatase